MGRVLMAAVAAAVLVCVQDARAEAPASEVGEARRRIDVTIAQMSSSALRLREDLRITRRRGTKAQIACVDQALSRADVATRRARETGEDTLVAYGRGDVEAARAALRRLLELRELSRLASVASGTCSAATQIVTQTATTVTVAIDPNIAPAPAPGR